MVRARYGLAVALAVILEFGACKTTHHVTTGCGQLKGHAVAVGSSERMSVFGNFGATVYFNRRFWKLASEAQDLSVPLYGTMTLWKPDIAVFRSDDARSFAFAPAVVGCG